MRAEPGSARSASPRAVDVDQAGSRPEQRSTVAPGPSISQRTAGRVPCQRSATASVQVSGHVAADPVTVSIVDSDDKDQLLVLDERAVAIAVVAARDHAGVQAVLESGLPLDLTLHGATLTLARAAAGRLSFTA